MKLFLDTNVIVSACLQEHEHHERALRVLQSIHSGRHEGFISAHTLFEAFSTLTRLPRAPRINPAQAAALLQENVFGSFTVVALTANDCAELLLRLGRSGIGGGQVYDAIHLRCAEKIGATRIYTFNVQHFAGLMPHLAARISAP